VFIPAGPEAPGIRTALAALLVAADADQRWAEEVED